ncbi:MAG: molecular chaperone DnaK, partial [Cyanobacteria bacterium NC_groundwater_1444_Ag_S-0.65um_54_12]|nr:molecular chaperone DnaK [Cyanobacteria bacterium NC_groundwater_1444_Ag_S-0.65um_54_12]
ALRELGDRASAGTRQAMIASSDQLREALKAGLIERIQAAMAEVQKTSYAFGEEIYAKTGTSPQSQAYEAERQAGTGEVIEAEFKEKS